MNRPCEIVDHHMIEHPQDQLHGLHHPSNYNISLTKAETEFTSLFTCFTFQKRTNSLWRKNFTDLPTNDLTIPSAALSQNSVRDGFENIWKQKWQSISHEQLRSGTCDSIVHEINHLQPLFTYIESKTPPVIKQVKSHDFPVFSIKVKKAKISDSRDVVDPTDCRGVVPVNIGSVVGGVSVDCDVCPLDVGGNDNDVVGVNVGVNDIGPVDIGVNNVVDDDGSSVIKKKHRVKGKERKKVIEKGKEEIIVETMGEKKQEKKKTTLLLPKHMIEAMMKME
jgi:hypothetical protein